MAVVSAGEVTEGEAVQGGQDLPLSEPGARTAGRWRVALALVLLAYLLLALGYSFATPAGEGPDEPGHIAYVQFLLAERRLPGQGEGAAALDQQVKHPPLYYLLGALATAWADYDGLLFFPNPQFSGNLEAPPVRTAHHHTADELWPVAPRYRAVRALRLVSVLLGLVLVSATWALAQTLLPGQPELALAAAALVAFLPQLLFMQGVANNDALAVPLAALALWMAARVALGSARRRDLVLLGTVVGLGLLTKLTTLATLGVALLGVGILAWRGRSWRLGARGALWLGAAVFLVAGWWFARNWANGGDPLGWGSFEQAAAMSLRRSSLVTDLPQYLYIQRTSFLGRFGWMTVPLPGPAYDLFAGLLVVAAVGLVALAIRCRRRPEDVANPLASRDARWGLTLAAAAVLLTYLSVLRMALSFDLVVAQGRYLFTALPAGAVLVAVGLLGGWPARWRPGGSIALALGAFSFALYALVAVLWPAFALPSPVLLDGRVSLRHGQAYRFGSEVDLLGDGLRRERFQPGEVAEVPLVWRTLGQPAAAYVLFGQILDAEGRLVGQVERIPLAGGYPSSSWLVGRTFADTLAIPIASNAAPGRAHVLVGWFHDGHPERRVPMRTLEGEPAPAGPEAAGLAAGEDAYQIPIVLEGARPVVVPVTATLRTDSWPVPAAGARPAAGSLRLVAFDTTPAPGGTLLLNLYWRPDVQLADELTVFVHLDQAGEVPVVTADGPPAAGRYPTPLWLPGETVLDAHRLDLGAVPPGSYRLSVGLYNGRTGARRPAFDDAGVPWPEGAVVLGEVVVGEGGAWVLR